MKFWLAFPSTCSTTNTLRISKYTYYLGIEKCKKMEYKLGQCQSQTPFSSEFWVQKEFGFQKIFGLQKCWVKKFWSNKIFGPTKFWVHKNFGSRKTLGPKKLWLDQSQLDLTCHYLTCPAQTLLDMSWLNLTWSKLTWPVLTGLNQSWLYLPCTNCP